MNKRLENKNLMILATNDVMDKHRSLWKDIPIFKVIMEEVGSNLTVIEETRKITEDDITGTTSDKNALEQELIQCVYELSSALCVMAKRTGNNELLEKVDFTLSELQTAREAELVSTSENVAILAKEHIDKLTDYAITADSVSTLNNLSARMKGMISAPRVSITERKTANSKLKEVMDNTCKLLEEQLDRLMLRFRKSHPEFYADYINARHTIAHGVRHKNNNEQEAA
ncbi:MAG: hypothetical protein JXB49_19370 [Bacteroidales bacterium]|nr:hypothetical protein [Bacteroidales bacterium]